MLTAVLPGVALTRKILSVELLRQIPESQLPVSFRFWLLATAPELSRVFITVAALLWLKAFNVKVHCVAVVGADVVSALIVHWSIFSSEFGITGLTIKVD